MAKYDIPSFSKLKLIEAGKITLDDIKNAEYKTEVEQRLSNEEL